MRKGIVILFGILIFGLGVGLTSLTIYDGNQMDGTNIPVPKSKANIAKVDEFETSNTKVNTTERDHLEREEKEQESFQAVVVAIEENAILVEPIQEVWKQKVSDRVRIYRSALDSGEELPKLQVGDWVEIVYNGYVMETYPTQLGTVLSVSKLEEVETSWQMDIDTNTKTAEYYTDYVNMQLQLPSDWEYEIVSAEQKEERGTKTFGIQFWPKEDIDFKWELFYWTEGIGMCGTGVTIEEIEFSNGMMATQYTEIIQENIWITIIYQNLPGTYVVSGSVPEALWEKYEQTFWKILESAELGKGVIDKEDALSIASEVFLNSLSMPESVYKEWEETRESAGFYQKVRTIFHWEDGNWEVKFYYGEKEDEQVVWLDAEGHILDKRYPKAEGKE